MTGRFIPGIRRKIHFCCVCFLNERRFCSEKAPERSQMLYECLSNFCTIERRKYERDDGVSVHLGYVSILKWRRWLAWQAGKIGSRIDSARRKI